ncbi:MAG: PorP/SprF family type IX secretion system membrane protein [Flavobacteriales bacterium]|nr:PorP/SprF family type IX secretion system membrane protein [Flavobacteriales bacterium]
MRRAYITSGWFILMSVLSLVTYAQDIQFSQYNAYPLYLNPALTGKIQQQRVALNSRSQWLNVDGAFSTAGFSYDYNLKNINSGLGIIVIQDETSGGGMATSTVGGLYSYHLRVGSSLGLNTGFKVSYNQQKLDPGKLTFTDQLLRNDGSSTYEIFDHLAHDYIDYSWGTVLYLADSSADKSYWLGMAFDHLTKPDVTFKGIDGKLPLKFTLHGGAQIRMSKNDIGFPENVISYFFQYKSQLKWDQAEFGASYIKRIPHKKRTMKDWKKTQAKFEPSYKQHKGYTTASSTPMPLVYAEGGLTYRGLPLFKKYRPGYSNHEAIIVLLGFNYYDVKVSYSYDLTISKLGQRNTAGVHEITMNYIFAAVYDADKRSKKKKAKKQKALFSGS